MFAKSMITEGSVMMAQGLPEQVVFGLDIGTRSIVGTVGYKKSEKEFVVIAQSMKFHETRAMLDGQIHDIAKVADTIAAVKHDLEKKTGRKLTDVCIAAAGRVLKTLTVKTRFDLEEEQTITEEHIRTMELCGVEEAQRKLRDQSKKDKVNYVSVGYTVVRYFLGDVQMSNLEGHKSSVIGADILATFLPSDVIDGLYTAVDRAGLKAVNLTLEPIAAINVAIPEKFRLLNLALVDIGAGTSDICITKEGSVVAYGMIPCAGDSLTEEVMQKYLVEFNEAENMKLSLSEKKKSIIYHDIIGIKRSVSPAELKSALVPAAAKLAKLIAAKILELNGGKPVSAIFLVGGGGKLGNFTNALADAAKLAKDRVALRGEEVLTDVEFLEKDIRKDPMLVTPIGICLNYYEQNNNFIFVSVNGERVKLYDNGRLTVMDATLAVGYPNENLFPKRGEALEFTLDGERRMIRGEAGESSVIEINGKPAAVTSPVAANDEIKVKESTAGAAGSCTVSKFLAHKEKLVFYVNGKKVECPRFASANGELVSEYYDIKSGDDIKILDYYTLEQVLRFCDIEDDGVYLVNNVVALPDDRVYENFSIDMEQKEVIVEKPAPAPDEPIAITVNEMNLVLTGKLSYTFVDILDFYPFSIDEKGDRTLVMRINGEDALFTSPLADGDRVDLYWAEPGEVPAETKPAEVEQAGEAGEARAEAAPEKPEEAQAETENESAPVEQSSEVVTDGV